VKGWQKSEIALSRNDTMGTALMCSNLLSNCPRTKKETRRTNQTSRARNAVPQPRAVKNILFVLLDFIRLFLFINNKMVNNVGFWEIA